MGVISKVFDYIFKNSSTPNSGDSKQSQQQTMSTPSAADKMASWFSRLSPVPAFPEYTGPYKVGSIDVEIPISQLTSPSPTPDGAGDIHTIQFRAFYPASPDSDGQPVTWLPAPQRLHLFFYTQFLGLGAFAANILSFLPRHLHWVTIPVHKNATLLPPGVVSGQSRWPTVVFSHGLGGSRNAYSHLAGSLASHGIVVICPEHRDGSSIVSLARSTESTLFLKYPSRVFPCIRIPHTNTPEVWAARDKQMRIRLWELGLNLEAILAIDNAGFHVLKYNMNESTPESAISQFSGKLDVQDPGKIVFGGHSFGAATMVQLLKSTYYAGTPKLSQMPTPLFTPSEGSAVYRQITQQTPTFLLDMWCFQLLSAASEPLFNLPLPAYDDVLFTPGGNAILAIESEGFYKWKDHLHSTARILSPNPKQKSVSDESFTRPTTLVTLNKPHFFYVRDGAHLNQSDFGLLFPWLTKKIFGGDSPERVMRLNIRALLQFFRENGVSGIAKTGAKDLVEGGVSLAKNEGGIDNDKAILSNNDDRASDVQAWVPINIVGLGAEAGPNERELVTGQVTTSKAEEAEQEEEAMEHVIEPRIVKHKEAKVPAARVLGGVKYKPASVESAVGAEAA